MSLREDDTEVTANGTRGDRNKQRVILFVGSMNGTPAKDCRNLLAVLARKNRTRGGGARNAGRLRAAA